MNNNNNKDIILQFVKDIYEDVEANEDKLRDYDTAIAETDNPNIKSQLKNLKESYETESRWDDAQYLWEEQLRLIDDITGGISNHITRADIGRWDGRHIHNEETEERYTLKEAVMNMTGCDDVEIYIEDGEVVLHGIHHDGHNYYIWGHKQGKVIKELLL